MQTRPPHLLIDDLMALTAEVPLIPQQHAADLALVSQVTGHALAVPSGRVTDPLGSKVLSVAIPAELFRRFGQQRRLSGRRDVGLMTGQAVPLGRRGMGQALGHRFLGPEMLEFVTLETEIGGIGFYQAGIIAGVRPMTFGAFALRCRGMRSGAGKSRFTVAVAAVTEGTPLGGNGKRGFAVGGAVAAVTIAFLDRRMHTGSQ
jgi:hypothetical protein